jgi:hypothetical protein
MAAAMFKPVVFPVSGFALSNIANIFVFMILLCTLKCTEFGKPHAYCGPMCTSGNCHWCGEPYFAGAAISIDRFLPQIPRQDKRKSLQI